MSNCKFSVKIVRPLRFPKFLNTRSLTPVFRSCVKNNIGSQCEPLVKFELDTKCSRVLCSIDIESTYNDMTYHILS